MASLLERLQADLSAAMKAGNDVEKSTLRMAIASVKNAAVAGDAAVTLTDDQVLGVLQSEAKKRAELAILERYLPARMSDDELVKIISEEVAAAAAQGATGTKAMGQVVKAVRARVGSGADGSAIAGLVKQALT